MKRTAWLQSLLALSLLALLSCDPPETAEEQSDAGAPSDTTSGTDAALDAVDDASLDDTADADADGSAADTELIPDGSGDPDSSADAGADTSPVPCSADADCPAVLCLLDSGATEGLCALPCDTTSDCNEGDLCLTIPGSALLGACVAPDYCRDLDGDLAGSGPGCSARDCNDGSSAIGPGMPEQCDGVDQDCDGAVDEEAGCSAAGESCDVLLDCAAGLLCDAGVCLAPAVCGDGSQGGAEQCDDGNLETERCAYGAASCEVCDSSCALVAGATSRCGDGERNLPDEACDSGDSVDLSCAYGERSCLVCNAFCSLVEGQTSFCGDGVVSSAERCDDGNLEQTDGCGNDCSCGAGFHLTGTTCEVDVRSCLLPNALVAEERWNGSSYDTCAPVSCNPTYHLEGGSCLSDERNCSSPDALVATERWNGSGYGNCEPSVCAAGLHVEAGVCVSNQRACSQPNATAAVESWTGTEYAGCTATACEADFHLDSGACLSDVRPCTQANAVTAVSRWNGGSFGACEAVSCVTEYHVEAQQCLFDLRACTAANATFALERWSAGAYRDCAATACIANYHVEGGACEPNTRSCTADAAITGEQYWLGSGYSVCAATSCVSGYHLESNSCLSDLRACTAPNADTATQAWNGTGYGPCTPSVCTVGFHLEGGACTSDQRSCSIANGTGSQSWTGSSWGACIAASCTLGFHVAAGQCESDVRSCLSPFAIAASEVWTGTGFGPCTPSACLSGYHLEAGLCAADLRGCPLQNATFATQSWTGSGYGACVAVSCTAGYHVESATCRSDTQACALANGTGSQQWLGSGYGSCTATACNAGYHIESGACASDIRSCSIANGTGSQTWNGTGYGTCAVTACNSSYHIESGACASDIRSCSITNGTGIQTWTGSAYGTCTISACDSAYHIESGVCVSNTRSCTIANGTGSQSWTGSGYGSCRATVCDTGFVAVAGSCVQAGLQQLGGACSANGDCISGSCSIDSGGLANAHCVPSGMVWVPSGTFQMGAPESEGSGGNFVHEVTLTRPHFADATEVTQGSWKALASGLNPSFFSSCGDSCPVEQLDWYSALAYANARSAAEGLAACYTLSGCADFANGWKDGVHSGCTDATFAGLTCTGYRLPTEAEWEFAARAGTTTATWLGGLTAPDTDCVTPQPNLDGIGWWCRNSGNATRPSGLKSPNPWGLRDTLGNVGEWTGDWFASYYQPTQTDPLGSDYGLTRVVRGGSWFEVSVNVRAAARSSLAQDGRSSYVGLRVARSAPQLSEGALCRIASSCESGVCSAGACAAPTCSDGVKNAAETGVDCGGPLCGSCAVGVTCLYATDCATGRCEYGLCRSCSDGLQTGAESDVDCGGVCVTGGTGGCGRDRVCAADGDCASGLCFNNRCAEDPRCFDGVQNGSETAVDCGGSGCAARCVVGTACTAGAQCATGNCAAGFCATAGDGGSCYNGADCQSGVCAGATNYEARSTYFGLTGSLTDGALSTAAGDTGSEVVSLPFTFTYFGSRYNAVAIHADGFLTFEAPPGATTPRGMPNVMQPNAVIAWMWRDNKPAAGSFRYATLGTAPYRRFIVNASGVASYAVNNAAASAQVILYETTNRVEIQCATCATSASAIVQGIENGAGTAAFDWNGRRYTSAYRDWSSTAVMFDPNAGLTCQAPTCSDGVKNGIETDLDCGGACGATCPGAATCTAHSDCATGVCRGGLCELGDDGELCTVESPVAADGRRPSTQCKSGVCFGTGAPLPIYTAPDPDSLGSLTAGTRASAFLGGTTVLGDQDLTPAIPIGFPFTFYGASYSTVRIDSNGWISFTATASSSAPRALPTAAAPNALIAGFWFDAAPSENPDGDVRYATVGTAPNRKFIVNYIGLPYYNTFSAPVTDNVTFQIALSEADNSVEVFCADCTLNQSALRQHGLENATGTAYRSGTSVAASLETTTTFSIPNNSGWRYPSSSLVGLECKAPTSSDFVKNGTETDVDCGGSSGVKCQYNQICSLAADCASNTCTSGLCDKASATGGCLRNADCVTNSCTVNSGTTLGTCNTGAAGASCGANADCANNNCVSNVCALSANGAACTANSECSSGWCFSATGPGAYLGTYAAITDSGSATSVPLSSVTTNSSMPIGFNFKYFGTTYTSVYGVLHGYLTFQASAPTVSSTPADVIVPGGSTTALNSIFAFWGNNTSATLKYWTEGTAPNRKFFAHFTNVVNATSTTTNPTADYYVILTETSNTVEVQCESCTQTAAATNARAQAVVNNNRTVGYQYPIANSTNTWLSLGGASKWTVLASISATQNTALRRLLYRTNYDSLVCTANPASAKPAAAPCTADSQCASGACNLGTPGVTAKTYVSRAPGASAIGATSATSTNTYLGDVTSTGAWLPLGFPINWYGTTYSSIRISPDGFVSFVSPTGTATNQTLPSTTAPNGVVALWWTDLAQANGSTAAATAPKIFWEQGGTYPNRFFTAYYVNYAHYSTSYATSVVNGHIRIFENGSRAEVVCDTCGVGSSHTQGVENGAGNGTAYFVADRNPAMGTLALTNDRQSFVVNTTPAFCE